MGHDYDTCGTQIDGKWCESIGRVWVRLPVGPHKGLRTLGCKKHAPLYEDGGADRHNLSIIHKVHKVHRTGTQKKTARILGISPAYLSLMLNGKRPWRENLKERYEELVNTIPEMGERG